MTRFLQLAGPTLVLLLGWGAWSLYSQFDGGDARLPPLPTVPNTVVVPSVPSAPAIPSVAQNAVSPTATRTMSPPATTPRRDPNRLRDFELKPQQEVQLSANEAATLIELNVTEGTEVTAQQLLGRQDDFHPQGQRKAALAERNAADYRSKLTIEERYARKSSEVNNQIWQKAVESNRQAPGSVSEVEIAEKRLKYEESVLAIEQATEKRKLEAFNVEAKQAEVDLAEDAIRRRQVIAPIAGTVVQITPKKGEWLKPGDPILRIINQERLLVEGYANKEQVMPDQLLGRTVTVEVEVSREKGQVLQVPAVIVFVSPEFVAGGDFRVRAEIVNTKLNNGRWQLNSGLTAALLLAPPASNP